MRNEDKNEGTGGEEALENLKQMENLMKQLVEAKETQAQRAVEEEEEEFEDEEPEIETLSPKLEREYQSIYKDYKSTKQEKVVRRIQQKIEQQREEIVQFLEEYGRQKKIKDFKWKMFLPKKARQWLEDATTPVGFFNKEGKWVPLEEASLTDLYKYMSTLPKDPFPDVNKIPFQEEKEVPEDIKGHYRFGIKAEEIEPYPLKLKEALSLKNAPIREVKEFRISKAIEKFSRKSSDTGSSEVQIAVMTIKIERLNEHMKKHHKDFSTKRGHEILVNRRRKLLKYLKRTKPEAYYRVIKEYKIPDEQFVHNVKKTVF